MSFQGILWLSDPLGNVVLQSKKEHEESIFTADINLEEVDKVRGQIPVFEDRRYGLVSLGAFMLFEESDLLKALPEQFFAGLVAKVNAKVAEGADVINLGQGQSPTNRPMTILLRRCAFQRKSC